MRILGIDPGSRKTGFGLIEAGTYHPKYLASGLIRVEKESTLGRLEKLHQGIGQLIAQYQPQMVAIEKIYVHKNPQTAITLGQARGVILLALTQAGLPIYQYSPTQIKSTIVGKGHAVKGQINYMVQQLLKLSASPQEDAADALAVALCHERLVKFGQSLTEYAL